MEKAKTEIKVSAADALEFLKSKGFSLAAVIKHKKGKSNQRLSPKQVERALMAQKRDKLKALCHHVSVVGHAHLYLSVMGDKVVLTGIDQLKANLKPFNRRGFGSSKHIGARAASLIGIAKAKDRKKPYLSRLSPEERREISRKGGIAAAKKRADHKAKIAARGPHWTQKPENKGRVAALLGKATAARHAKKAAGAK